MARGSSTAYYKSIPVGLKLRLMAEDTLESIKRNCATQGIFPVGEVYPGYFKKNASASPRSWKSSGHGFKSFSWQVKDVVHQYDIAVQTAAIDFFYDYHLKFVDMGVGKNRPISKVRRNLDADHEVRYLAWNSKEGSTQRPAIMIEFRHQSKRLADYMIEHYKYEGQMALVNGIEGITGIDRNK